MIARYRKTTHRLIRTARGVTKALAYWTLSGRIAAHVEAGRLIQCSEFLRRLGLDEDLIRSLRSWFGRYATKAWRAATDSNPLKVWTLIDGRWTHVAVYEPNSFAFPAAITSYKRMAKLNLSYELAV